MLLQEGPQGVPVVRHPPQRRDDLPAHFLMFGSDTVRRFLCAVVSDLSQLQYF